MNRMFFARASDPFQKLTGYAEPTSPQSKSASNRSAIMGQG